MCHEGRGQVQVIEGEEAQRVQAVGQGRDGLQPACGGAEQGTDVQRDDDAGRPWQRHHGSAGHDDDVVHASRRHLPVLPGGDGGVHPSVGEAPPTARAGEVQRDRAGQADRALRHHPDGARQGAAEACHGW